MKIILKPEDLPTEKMLMEEYKNLLAAADYLEENAEYYNAKGNTAMAEGMKAAAAERRKSAARVKEQMRSSSSSRKKSKKKQKKQKLNKAAAAFLEQLIEGGKQK